MVLSLGLEWKEASKEVLCQNWVLRGDNYSLENKPDGRAERWQESRFHRLKVHSARKRAIFERVFVWSVRKRRRRRWWGGRIMSFLTVFGQLPKCSLRPPLSSPSAPAPSFSCSFIFPCSCSCPLSLLLLSLDWPVESLSISHQARHCLSLTALPACNRSALLLLLLFHWPSSCSFPCSFSFSCRHAIPSPGISRCFPCPNKMPLEPRAARDWRHTWAQQ